MRDVDFHSAQADRYFELIRVFPLRPIRSDEELDRAIARVDALLASDDLGAGEQDYLDVLGDLIEKYESTNHPIPDAPPADVLRHLIDARGVTQAKVAADNRIAESTISAILSGKRVPNRKHVMTLARYFKVSPAVFLPD
jgi:HTH-type transcriptional regulator/antitoxin HigA